MYRKKILKDFCLSSFLKKAFFFNFMERLTPFKLNYGRSQSTSYCLYSHDKGLNFKTGLRQTKMKPRPKSQADDSESELGTI